MCSNSEGKDMHRSRKGDLLRRKVLARHQRVTARAQLYLQLPHVHDVIRSLDSNVDCTTRLISVEGAGCRSRRSCWYLPYHSSSVCRCKLDVADCTAIPCAKRVWTKAS